MRNIVMPRSKLLARIVPLAMLFLVSTGLQAEPAMTIFLTGASEVPAVITAATASGQITILPDRSVSGSITTAGLTPTMAHIHEGAVVEFRERVRAADAILFATPECNHAVPGGLKSAIDWAARPVDGCDCAWAGKPAAVMTATTGCLTTLRAQHHLRQMLATLQMPTVDHPAFMKGIAAARFGPDGSLHDESTRQFIQQVVLALVTLVRVNWSARRHGTKASA